MKKLILILLLGLLTVSAYSQLGNALNFDGTGDGIDLNTALLSTTNGSQAYTIEAWIKAPSQGDNCIVCQYTFPGDNRFQFEIRTNKLNWWKGYASTSISILSSASITDNQWHHVAATKDGSGNVTLYIDGVQDGTGVDILPYVNSNSTIGERISTNSGHFNGNIDEVRIWNISRTQTAIQSTMNQELVGNESGLIAYYNFNQGIAEGNNAGVTTLNDGTSNGNNGTLTDFALIGSTSNWVASNAFLPVELISFGANLLSERIKLNWITASELNNSGFEIQKSENGADWEIISFTEGRGASIEINEYEYTDRTPFSGINYYRLKQIDFDGAFEYSKVIEVNFSKERKLQFYPNPANDKIKIGGIEEGEIVIMDHFGRTILQTNYKGSELDISDLANGLYFVKVNSGNQIWIKRLIKE